MYLIQAYQEDDSTDFGFESTIFISNLLSDYIYDFVYQNELIAIKNSGNSNPVKYYICKIPQAVSTYLPVNWKPLTVPDNIYIGALKQANSDFRAEQEKEVLQTGQEEEMRHRQEVISNYEYWKNEYESLKK